MQFSHSMPTFLSAMALILASPLVSAIDRDGDGMNHIVDPNDYEHRYSLALSEMHSCLIDDNGVQCWGDNRGGISELSMSELSTSPFSRVETYEGPFGIPTEVAAGGLATCVAYHNGDFSCWGNQENAPFYARNETQNGIKGITVGNRFFCIIESIEGDRDFLGCIGDAPEGQPDLEQVHKVRAGDDHACAFNEDGLHCWGPAESGLVPETFRATEQFALGYRHTCAIDADGVVECWGRDTEGQTTPPDLSNPYLIAAGPGFSCAADDTGIVCWGQAIHNGEKLPPPPPLTNVYQLDLGVDHICALSDEGLSCWGIENSIGVAAGAAITDELYQADQVAFSDNQVCGRAADGITCFGYGESTSPPPLTVNPSLAGGSSDSICAATNLGPACWGQDTSMELSPGSLPGTLVSDLSISTTAAAAITVDSGATFPMIWGNFGAMGGIPYEDGDSFSDIWIASDRGCVMRNGGLYCWDDSGERIAPITEASLVSLSTDTTCAISGGVPHCWGETEEDTALWQASTPAMFGVTDIVISNQHFETTTACALNSTAVRCWNKFEEVPAPELANPTAIARTGELFCALADNGLTCWGTRPPAEPTPTLHNPALLENGHQNSHRICAIDNKGVICWGERSASAYRQAFFASRPQFSDSDGDGTPDDLDGEPFDPNRTTVNQLPIARISARAEYVEDTGAYISGDRSEDSDGTILEWAWDTDTSDGVDFTVADAYGESIEPTFSEPGEYTVSLRVTDNGGATHSSSVIVTILSDRDGDRVPDKYDDFPDAPSASIDGDNDGYPDSCTSESACLDDGLELDRSLNDFDNDGIPTDEDTDDTVDTNPPYVVAPPDVSVTATGVETEVDLLQGKSYSSWDFPGTIVPLLPETPENATTLPLTSGRHLITWCASDSAGNRACDVQTVDITPLVTFDQTDQLTVEGVTVSVLVSLSGNPVTYPVTVPVQLEESGTAESPDDHDASSRTLIITEDDPEDDLPANSAQLLFNTVDDGVTGELTETVIFSLVENNGESELDGAALGSPESQIHTVGISEENIPPVVTITSAEEVVLDGPVATGSVTITDPNNHDEYLVSWYLDGALIASGINLMELEYDISEITAGSHSLRVTALDNGDPARLGEDQVDVIFEAPPIELFDDSDSGGASTGLLLLLALQHLGLRRKRKALRQINLLRR